MTTTAFKSGKDMEAANSMTWDYIKQGMNPEETAIAEGTEKTRKIVARTLDVVLERVEPTPAYWQTTYLTANAGQGAALEKMETMMKCLWKLPRWAKLPVGALAAISTRLVPKPAITTGLLAPKTWTT